MSLKFIFLDIDGTLLGKEGRVPQSAVDAIRLAQKKGHKVCLSTGRSKGEIPQAILQLGFDGMVASAGAYVELDGKVLAHQPMPQELVCRLADALDGWGAFYAMETNGKAYITKEHMEKFKNRLTKEGLWEADILEEFLDVFEICDSVRDITGVNKCIYHESKESIERMREELPEFLILPSSLSSRDKNDGEICEQGMSKAVGIGVMQRHFNVAREDIICFGDGLNDIEMIEHAGIGVAMGNAAEELKKRADHVTGHVDEDGLLKGFKELGLVG